MLLLGCEADKIGTTVCTDPCYSGPAQTRHVGACHDGQPVCDASGEFVSCSGEVKPNSEVCDGIDNDCDGIVDGPVIDVEIDTQCSTLPNVVIRPYTTCRYGYNECINGSIRCVGAVGPSPEICDGLDNDCNGLIDDIQVTETCYSGDIQQLVPPKSTCRAGVLECIHGAMTCVGEVGPIAELCDGLDNDCNGLVDDGLDNLHNKFDIVLIVDESGSMSDKLPQIIFSLTTFVIMHSGEDYRYSIVAVPGSMYDFTPVVLLPLTSNATVTLEAISTLNSSQGGTEWSYDAIAGVATGMLNIGWQQGNKKIVIWYGDESAQESDIRISQSSVAAAAAAAAIEFYAFIDPVYVNDYAQIAAATHGAVYSIYSDVIDQINELESSVTQSCN